MGRQGVSQNTGVLVGSVNGLSPGRRQAIIWTYDGILSICPSAANFNEMLIEIHTFHHTFSFKKMLWKMLCVIWRLVTGSSPAEQCTFPMGSWLQSVLPYSLIAIKSGHCLGTLFSYTCMYLQDIIRDFNIKSPPLIPTRDPMRDTTNNQVREHHRPELLLIWASIQT